MAAPSASTQQQFKSDSVLPGLPEKASSDDKPELAEYKAIELNVNTYQSVPTL